ncbi:MAG: hypothetical protein ABGX16_16025, partial [Pirellulales bacterium]
EHATKPGANPHISPVSATASQILLWLRYVSSAILNVYKTRLRSQTSHALPQKDLKHLATKRMKYPG